MFSELKWSNISIIDISIFRFSKRWGGRREGSGRIRSAFETTSAAIFGREIRVCPSPGQSQSLRWANLTGIFVTHERVVSGDGFCAGWKFEGISTWTSYCSGCMKNLYFLMIPEQDWREVKTLAAERNDFGTPCPICKEDIGSQRQVLLSCSHVFHHNCLQVNRLRRNRI